MHNINVRRSSAGGNSRKMRYSSSLHLIFLLVTFITLLFSSSHSSSSSSSHSPLLVSAQPSASSTGPFDGFPQPTGAGPFSSTSSSQSSTGAGSNADSSTAYNPLPDMGSSSGGSSSSTGIADPFGTRFGDNLPDQPPTNITYLPNQCQFVTKWKGPRCPANYECVSDRLARQTQDGQFHLSYKQEQCVFCAATEFCTTTQKDECKQADVLTSDDATIKAVNETLGIGDCQLCKEGQYCPAIPAQNLGTINPFGLAIVNLCQQGAYCPTAAQIFVCPVGFYCPPGTKFPLACTETGTFCPEGSTSPLELCPGGNYCPDPQTIIRCPSGYFCKSGSIEPKKCQALASCPSGSAAALLVWQGIIFVILIYILLAAVYYGVRYIQKRNRRKELAANEQRAEGAEVVQLLKSLRTFQNMEQRDKLQREYGSVTPNGEYVPPTPDSSVPRQDYASGSVQGKTLTQTTAGAPLEASPERAAEEDLTPHLGKLTERHSSKDEDASGEPLSPAAKENKKHENHCDFALEKTVNDDYAVVRTTGDADGNHQEVVGLAKNTQKKASFKNESSPGMDEERAKRHENVEVVNEKTGSVRTLPTSVDVKTDADATKKDGEEDDEDDDDDSDDDDDGFTGFDPIPCPVTISFENLGLKLSDGKQILKGVSGVFPHSQLTALMGPSGSGKSTFLNVLCGKAHFGTRTGTVKINGVESSMQALKSVIGYVPQDDVLHSDLTCYENLYYNAMLRLPRKMPYSQKKQIVDDVIKMLGLEAVQHSVVGSVEKRGISGGQRKRVNIGMEIVSWPTVLFMDEPTSGLDSTASLEVISALRDLTDLGVSIITVIHQPRFSIVELFHEMLLLGRGGQSVFLGNSSQALTYFQDLGFLLPPNENPADFFLDIISGEIRREGDPDFQPKDLFELWEKQGEWVRERKERPDHQQGLLKDGIEENVSGTTSDDENDAAPGASPRTSTGPRSSNNQRLTLNVSTPSHGAQNQNYYRYTGNMYTPAYGSRATSQNAITSPLQRSNTFGHGTTGGLQNTGLTSYGHPSGASYLLPAPSENRRAYTGGDARLVDQNRSVGGSSIHNSRSPAGYFYPISNDQLHGNPSHRRTRTQYHALNAYRHGITNPSDLPLPRQRELLNRLGKDGIGKLVEDYQAYQHHPHSSKHSNRHGVNNVNAGRRTPRTPGDALQPSPMVSGSPAFLPATSVKNSNAKQQKQHGSHTPRAPLRQASIRRLNLLFDRPPNSTRNNNNFLLPSARNLNSSRGKTQPGLYSGQHELLPPTQNFHHILPAAQPTQGQLQQQTQQIQLSPAFPSPQSLPLVRMHSTSTSTPLPHSVEETDWEVDPSERTPLSMDMAAAVQAASQHVNSKLPVSQRLPPAPSRAPRNSSQLGGIDESGEERAASDGVIENLKPNLDGRTSPSRSKSVRFHDDAIDDENMIDHSAQDLHLHDIDLNDRVQMQKAANSDAIPVARHGRTGSYQPALESISSEGEIEKSPSTVVKKSEGMDVAAGSAAVVAATGGDQSSALVKKDSLKNNNTTSAASTDKTDAVAMKMGTAVEGQVPPPRVVPYIHEQFLYLLQRQSLKLLRSINEVVFDMSLTTAVGLAIGLIFGGVWSLNGYATISTMAVLSIGVLSCVSALKMFGNDRVVFWRESSAGINVTAYWLAVTLMHLPLTVVFSFLFVAPYYNLILPDVSFLETWWVFIAIHFSCSGGGMLLSVVFNPIPALLSGVMIPLIIGGFLNGVSPALSDQGSAMTFLCDISYSRYGVEALMIQELGIQPDYASSIVDDVFSTFGFRHDHFKFAIGILFVIGSIFRILTLLALHGLHRDKRR